MLIRYTMRPKQVSKNIKNIARYIQKEKNWHHGCIFHYYGCMLPFEPWNPNFACVVGSTTLTHNKFHQNRSRSFRATGVRKLGSLIDFACRPYNRFSTTVLIVRRNLLKYCKTAQHIGNGTTQQVRYQFPQLQLIQGDYRHHTLPLVPDLLPPYMKRKSNSVATW